VLAIPRTNEEIGAVDEDEDNENGAGDGTEEEKISAGEAEDKKEVTDLAVGD